MISTYFGLNYFELTHLPHFLLLCVNVAVSLRSYVFIRHSGGSCVCTNTMEFWKSFKHFIMLRVFPFLDFDSSCLIVAAHHILHGGWWSVWSAERCFDISNVYSANVLLFSHNSVTWSFKSNWFGKRLSELRLVKTCGYFFSSCNFIESFEVFVIGLGSLWLLVITNPLRCYYRWVKSYIC